MNKESTHTVSHVSGKRLHKKRKGSESDSSDSHESSKKQRFKHKTQKQEESSSSETSSSSSTSSSSTDSSEEERKKRKKERKKLKKLKKKLKDKKSKSSSRDSKRSKMSKKSNQSVELEASADIPLELMDKSKSMAPMTKEDWEKRQSVVRRVYDETTGRHRLIKGDGEVIEELVSKERHKQINLQATKGDGDYFQTQISSHVNNK